MSDFEQVISLPDIVYRPRSITDILDTSFHLFRQHFRPIVTLTAVSYLPLAVFSLLYARYAGFAGDTSAAQFQWSMLVLFPIQLIWFTIMSSLVTVMTSRAYLDEPLEASRIWSITLPRILSAIVAFLIIFVIGGIGLIFFVIPGIYFYTRFFAAPTVAVLEGAGFSESLTRASVLSRDRKLHIFAVVFFALLLYLIVLTGIGIVALLMSSIWLRSVISFFGTIFTWPIIPIVQTVLYYDLRIRAEGYDVELMSRRLDQSLSSTAEATI